MDLTAASLTAATTTTVLAAATTSIFSNPISSATQAASHVEVNPQDDGNGECRLLGSFSLIVQAALGALALLSLVYKRWRERPQRPVKVWAFDVSKQVFGSAMLHLANLLMSMFSAGQFDITSTYKPNPCSFYLLNIGIDTTLGIPILIFILRIMDALASYTPLANPPESIESGNYGHPPRATWWFKQSIIYFIGLLGMKICVFFLIHFVPFIVKVGDWALRWTEGNTAVQVIFVMLLFPLIMNAIQYYIIDTFIKKPMTPVDEMLAEDDDREGTLVDDENDQRNALLAGLEDDGLLDAEEGHAKNGKPLDSPLHAKEALHGFSSIRAMYDHTVGRMHSSSSSSGSSSSSHS